MTSTFLLMLSGGLLAMAAALRVDWVPRPFFRFAVVLASVLAGVWFGLGFRSLDVATWIASGLCGVLLLALVVVTASEAAYAPKWVRPLSGAGAFVALVLAGLTARGAGLWPASGSALVLAAAASMLLSACLIGSVMAATMLGHAYLTATKMTIDPLRRLAGLFATAMVVRCVWAVAIAGGMAWLRLRAGGDAADGVRREVLMISVRVGVGLLVPAVFAYMVWETVRLRATQSATGILYFAMVLVFVGELTAMYLLRETGIPF